MQKKIDRLVAFEVFYLFLGIIMAGFCIVDLCNSHIDRAIAWGAMAVALSSRFQCCNMRIRLLNNKRYYE